jgi:hypothetical protein
MDFHFFGHWHQIEWNQLSNLLFNRMDRLLQIVQGCHKYDRRSQRLFYERYYGYALRISFRYLDSYEEATQLTKRYVSNHFPQRQRL